MPRQRFYDDRDEEDDEETEAYVQGGDPSNERHSRSRSRDDSRDRGRHRGRRREGRRARERSESEELESRPRSFVGQNLGAEKARYEEEPSDDSQLPTESELAERVAATVTANLKTQLTELLANKNSTSEAMAKEVEALRAAQKHSSLLNEATELSSESAQKQFIAFAKVKNGVTNARRLVTAGDTAGAEEALKEVEKIADFRIDMIRRADSMPGGWAAANVYEKKVAGQVDKKNDKVWKAAVEEANQNRKDKKFAGSSSGRSYSRQPFKGEIS